ncbi:MAG: Phosphoribosylaminoimidazolecarboxamide formyltransferase [Thermodesulfobacterium sp. 37_54]|jgi:phosphoribosylaminoimidazolecarboxamide formyltransferase/IMP cyclohydrolase|uniref:IMP cyclohydrolase n=2 Tax=Thermodesulfobacterium commune TaxID=1741 RepID=A0A075WUQ5_9BACT|nr:MULTISPECIES: IMP cyclohydrolase [Thermodesulfobacterium]KUJ97769.1 MAG: Phosphoribosylaminoimidazolecarboxamide formyltransferase [Thermodesulfobacterium sp. 37_54]KUK19396.1 MAG: Phosphoribosylaminoimidazolecarboxamide formyltransferase [Thermodesulfobacterium commune]AIH04158.1 IMP cyclohydrolase [Thermodesulfobacterium commune DSM 2178]KUK37507.1 MAG: Phosphoribosylaminoimidazolecarboxamide formyltransferase [Thermodesulfobacterium commune]MDN5380436.1 phosphoribosylaminoimidazolecarbox
MAEDLKKMYYTIVTDHFPSEIRITFGDQTLIYKKRTWDIEVEPGVIERRGLRYGENPDQEAALYELVAGNLILGECEFIHPNLGLVSSLREQDFIQFGKHPSKINLTDIDSGLNILRYLNEKPCCVIIKHNNPSGVAYGNSLEEAFLRAFKADRIAAFGGVVVLNRPVDKACAEAIASNYFEVVVAPEYEEGAIEILKAKKSLRIIRIKRMDRLQNYRNYKIVEFKSLIDGGLIVQVSQSNKINRPEDLKPAVAVKDGIEYKCLREPTEREVKDMLFGWAVELGVTSNSVLFVKDECTVAIGTGEQDRVGCTEIAIFKAYTKFADLLCYEKYGIPYKQLELEVAKGIRPKEDKERIDEETKEKKAGLIGAVMVSDGFLPFRDSVDVVAKQGVTAILQPGGSIRDWEVIEACNEYQIAMKFTGQRAFRH